MRVTRKVKIDGKWLMAPVPMDSKGRPDPKHVMYKDALVRVDGGTFYIATGRGVNRKSLACGEDVEAVRRAMKTQAHVLELRSRGMEVQDAPEIVESRRTQGKSLRELARAFKAEPPTGFTKKTVSKYENAFRTFAEFAASIGVYGTTDVTVQTITRWIASLQKEGLDASTIVPKVRIILAELREKGNDIKLDDRTLPKITERERSIYSAEQLDNLFRACDRDEFELYQTYLISGMRNREVAFLGVTDLDPARATLKVTRKRELGFVPKTYEEREVPISFYLVSLLQERIERLELKPTDLLYGTSRAFFKRGPRGGRADKKHLDKLKQIARRSDLNCGHCQGMWEKKPVTCATHPVCKLWGLHKFRHTYATSMLRDKIDIVTVSKWLGHKDLATTRIYLRALEAEMGQTEVEKSTLARRWKNKAPVPGSAKRHSRNTV